MNIRDEAIRQVRQHGDVSIVPRRYSPSHWDADRSKPSALRQAAYKHQPQMCVFYDTEGPRMFIAFGGMDGMNAALDVYLGPIQ